MYDRFVLFPQALTQSLLHSVYTILRLDSTTKIQVDWKNLRENLIASIKILGPVFTTEVLD